MPDDALFTGLASTGRPVHHGHVHAGRFSDVGPSRQHALVTDRDGRIRGIFSATQIARQLGVDAQSVDPTEIAQTFAEIETLLAH